MMGLLTKLEGDETNPSNNGKLCPKGNAGIMRHYDPQRFKEPLRRTNPEKGPGIDPKWEPISWEEAFEITARESRSLWMMTLARFCLLSKTSKKCTLGSGHWLLATTTSTSQVERCVVAHTTQ